MLYVCMYVIVWRQGAALGPLWCPQPTFRFEGHIGDIHAKRTAQAGELYNGHARVIIKLGSNFHVCSALRKRGLISSRMLSTSANLILE